MRGLKALGAYRGKIHMAADFNAPLPDARPLLDPSVRERWNDYGIGLLLQGDLKGAEAAFRQVMRMDPPYADGPVNVARVLVQEGDVEAARASFGSAA